MDLLNHTRLKSKLKSLEVEVQKWLEPHSNEKPTPLSDTPDKLEQLYFQFPILDFSTNDPEEFFILLFSRMSIFYERGFLFETSENSKEKDRQLQWASSIYFIDGKIHLFEAPLKAPFTLPALSLTEVQRSKPSQWPELDSQWSPYVSQTSEWSALLIRLTDRIQFMLLTTTADHWLKEKVEKTYDMITKALSELP